jgi:hypothetical protein
MSSVTISSTLLPYSLVSYLSLLQFPLSLSLLVGVRWLVHGGPEGRRASMTHRASKAAVQLIGLVGWQRDEQGPWGDSMMSRARGVMTHKVDDSGGV